MPNLVRVLLGLQFSLTVRGILWAQVITIHVGSEPTGLVIGDDRVFVSNQGSHSISVIRGSGYTVCR